MDNVINKKSSVKRTNLLLITIKNKMLNCRFSRTSKKNLFSDLTICD